MAVFTEPTKWAQTLGQDADVASIPDTAGETDPSIDKIFPSVFSIPLANGGRAIPRSVLNGLFKLVGDWSFYQQNGGLASYSPDFDYTVGRVVLYNNNIYKCIQDNGASSTVVNPNNVAYWQRLDGSNLIPNQIITSPVPLSDVNLHLCDGALLSGSGAYAQYVSMMIALYNSDTSASCWTDEATWQSSVSTYGECGKFVIDTVNNNVRLPKLKSFIQATTTASELGDLVEAGAPNVVASANITPQSGTTGLLGGISGAFYASNPAKTFPVTESSDVSKGRTLNFDASRSSSVYGNSNTIQPQAIKYYFYIVVGTVSKTQIQIDIDNVLADLALKADTDLSNINNTAKIAIAHNASLSNVYDELTLGASGSVYTAPADGFFSLVKNATAVNQYVRFAENKATPSWVIKNYENSNSGNCCLVSPLLKKGQQISIMYTAGGTYLFNFIYAVGSESEQ